MLHGENERNYQIVGRHVDTARVNDGMIQRSGRLAISFEGRTPHMVAFDLKQYVTRGNAAIALEVIDETVGSASNFALDDETTAVLIQSDGGGAQIVFNADDTLTVDGTQFASPIAVAGHLNNSAALNGISDEALAAVREVLGGEDLLEDTARAAAVVVAVVNVVTIAWIVSSDVVCRREYRRKNYNKNSMSHYCRGWCTANGWCP